MNRVEISHIQPGFRYEIRTKILGTNSGAKNRETKQAFLTPLSVKLQLNGMLMMWKIQQAKQDGVILFQRIHATFIPVTGLKCSHGKIFQPAYRDTGWKNRDLVNRASPPSHMNTLGPFIRGKIRRGLYHLYEHVLSKTKAARINGSRLISVLDSFSC